MISKSSSAGFDSKRWAEDLFLHWKFGHGEAQSPCNLCEAWKVKIADALNAAFLAGVAQGKEEAAQIVEHHVNSTGPLRKQIASAIRGLGGNDG